MKDSILRTYHLASKDKEFIKVWQEDEFLVSGAYPVVPKQNDSKLQKILLASIYSGWILRGEYEKTRTTDIGN